MTNATRNSAHEDVQSASASQAASTSSRGFFPRVLGFLGRRQVDPSLRESLEEVIEEHQERSTSITEEEQLMLLNILHFGEARVEDVMVPRADIVAVEQDELLEDLIKVFCEAGHSRLPKAQANAISKLRRPVLFVPPSMPALDLFLKMQTTRTHMALVIDEYGGTDGLVTIEDLVEEIVGEIEDEHDNEEGPLIEKQGAGMFLVDARALIEELEELVGVKLIFDEEDEDLDTVGGLIFTMIDRVPERGELITHPRGLEFEVLDADPRRVKKVRIRIKSSSRPQTSSSVEASQPDAASKISR
jgi:CBS domain containing-hemolysin-like protein